MTAFKFTRLKFLVQILLGPLKAFDVLPPRRVAVAVEFFPLHVELLVSFRFSRAFLLLGRVRSHGFIDMKQLGVDRLGNYFVENNYHVVGEPAFNR